MCILMNNRTRQWFKANQMLDKYDPPVMVFVKDPGNKELKRVLLIRQSQLEAAKEVYGDDLEVMC